MKKIYLFLALCCMITANAQKVHKLSSPNGQLGVEISVGDKIYYDITLNGEKVLEKNTLEMSFAKQTLGVNPKLAGVKSKSVKEALHPAIPFKFSTIQNDYNQLDLKFKGNYSVEFRAFDEGVAYRFVTHLKGDVEVMDELFQVSLPQNTKLHVQQAGHFKTSYEDAYRHLNVQEWNDSGDKYSTLPLLMETGNGCKVLISEAALADYPAMFLSSRGAKGKLTSLFPKNPLEFGEDGDRSLKLTKEADYIAKTKGTRAFPWRYFVVCKEDGKILENTMTARLSEPNALADISWIKPGVTTWEWWNGATPYGTDVTFKAGCNTDTYKYFIDFASKFGIEYILLDEGWAKSTRDPFTPNKDLDLQELIRYGKQKNVGIILWLTWLTVENHFDLFEKFEQWGVKGVKIDFMDRSDQWMVNYYERVAVEAAKHHLFVDFHGSFKPAGLEYKYPNVLSYEGVRGMEQMGGCRPENSIYFPFMRNAVGPMDYTPGAMLNYQPRSYRADRPNSGSCGTRAYQMALYVLFETGLQMMADNPTLYYQNEDCARFMADVPVMTDETIALAAKIGEYAIVAKRKGDKWYIGGMANEQMDNREFELPLDFLPKGKTMRMTSYEDGANANYQAMHYIKNVRDVKAGQRIKVKMVRNGGFAAVIE